MDPCPFVRFVIGNLALRFPPKSHLSSFSYYCKLKFKGFPTQFSDVSFLAAEIDAAAVESKVHGCFALNKADLEKQAEKSTKFSSLKIEIHRRSGRGSAGCGFVSGGKLVGCAVVQLDLKGILENMGKCVIQNGWVLLSGSDVKLHLNVRAEPDPRFVFLFDGEPECSPQVFQVNGNVKQPVFTCKFGFRNSGERILRSRSCLSEASTSARCFGNNEQQPSKERKGWSITIHDLSGSPVAAASMVTPFVPSPGTDRVSRSNPGAWLILRPGHGTWTPWGRLEAWSGGGSGDHLGYRFDLIPDGGIDAITLANSSIPTKTGGKCSIDITTGPTPMTSPNSSFDLSSGSGSGSDIGSTSGSGSWAHLLYRGFVMSSTVQGDGKCSKPEVEVGVQHVSCAEDAAAFVALAAAMDLSMDAIRPFSRKLRKELQQPDIE
ncbi:formin-like protein [Perilla frutescens var. hirtella]|nr:formin-like protein [Perilla frutescens var. hirtella]